MYQQFPDVGFPMLGVCGRYELICQQFTDFGFSHVNRFFVFVFNF